MRARARRRPRRMAPSGRPTMERRSRAPLPWTARRHRGWAASAARRTRSCRSQSQRPGPCRDLGEVERAVRSFAHGDPGQGSPRRRSSRGRCRAPTGSWSELPTGPRRLRARAGSCHWRRRGRVVPLTWPAGPRWPSTSVPGVLERPAWPRIPSPQGRLFRSGQLAEPHRHIVGGCDGVAKPAAVKGPTARDPATAASVPRAGRQPRRRRGRIDSSVNELPRARSTR